MPQGPALFILDRNISYEPETFSIKSIVCPSLFTKYRSDGTSNCLVYRYQLFYYTGAAGRYAGGGSYLTDFTPRLTSSVLMLTIENQCL